MPGVRDRPAAEVTSFCSQVPGAPATRESCYSQCLHRTNVSFAGCQFGLPLERSHLVRAFALFDAGSRFVAKKQVVAAWDPATQQALRDFFLAQTQGMLHTYPENVYISSPLNMFGSENIDSSGQVTTYLALDGLKSLPEYASLKMADGRSVGEHYQLWEEYMYGWLQSKAQRGLFSELGSTGYWSRTWPNILNLHDLPSSSRVRMRAKMFIDIAMVEAEQASIAGVRAGQKSRCKKGGFSHSEGITHSFYTSCTPQLYGTDLGTWPSNNTVLPASNRIIENEAGWYEMSNVSILAHVLGKSPKTDGSYMVQNRLIGQVDVAQTVKCSEARCNATLRPAGCTCTHGADAGEPNSHYTMLPVSNQVHTIWHTPSYALGGVMFSPNDYFSPNSQQR